MSGQVQQLEPEAVYGYLHSRAAGLGPAEVAELRHELGPNRLEGRPARWWVHSLGRQFGNFFSLLLDLSAGICFFAEHVQPGEGMALLGWTLLAVSVLNAGFSFVQEYRAERAMEALRRLLPEKVAVRREGVEGELLAVDLVPGDVVLLREGDKVPADLRLVESDRLLVDNAALTGESRPLSLVAKAATGELLAADNVAFAGCTVLRGNGTGVAFATGLRTQFGRIAALSQDIQRKASPLERETRHMVRVLTLIAVAMGLLLFAYGVWSGRSLWVNLVFMMGIIVANVPEGLLPTFTLSLAMASLRMARRKVLIKSLNAVEALGAVHVVCTDKTGTLTQNRLTLVRAVDATGDTVQDTDAEIALLSAALMASDVAPRVDGYGGDPLDVAIVERYTARIGTPAPLIAGNRMHFPFDVELRRSAGVGEVDGRLRFAVKGAWEAMAPMLAGADLARAGAVVQALAREGLRVLAVASRELETAPAAGVAQQDLEQALHLHGFICLEDPLRAEVPEAVQRCHRAGIRVLMITGDHPDTALSVARAAGIATDADPPPLSGDEIATLREQDLVERLAAGVSVCARTTPEQKMKIVAALHQLDLVVAVTGDGVNDAPALKAADVGIAMGASGTDVARESAQVVLLDDNFASIVAGIEEGRAIFANIRKFTSYVLVSNGPEILPYLLYIIFPVPLALTVIHILFIDLGTDIVPSMGLGQEPPEDGVMEEPPRPREASLLSREVLLHSYGFLGLIEAAFSLALFFHVLHAGGWAWGVPIAADDPLYRSATGIALATILLMQVGNVIGRRSRLGSGLDRGLLDNRLLLAGIALELLFSWAVLYFEPLTRLLGTGPVETTVYALAWAGIPLIFGLDWLRKRVLARRLATA